MKLLTTWFEKLDGLHIFALTDTADVQCILSYCKCPCAIHHTATRPSFSYCCVFAEKSLEMLNERLWWQCVNSTVGDRVSERPSVNKWLPESTPVNPVRVFQPPLSAGVITLLCSSSVWSLEVHTRTRLLTLIRHGGAVAHCQLNSYQQRMVRKVRHAEWGTCGLTASHHTNWKSQQLQFAMEFGRVWFKYQKTVLITMMMFKLGKAAHHVLQLQWCSVLLTSFESSFSSFSCYTTCEYEFISILFCRVMDICI